MISLDKVGLYPDEEVVLSGISLNIEPGEFVCLTGQPGSGKTPLLKIIAGLDDPSAGTVSYDGIYLKTAPSEVRRLLRKRVAYVGSNPLMTEGNTVEQMIDFPMSIWAVAKEERDIRTGWLSNRLGLKDIMNNEVSGLPYPKQKLVAIARALSLMPMVIVIDDPWESLNEAEQDKLSSLLKFIHKQGVTIICGSDKTLIPAYLPLRLIELHQGTIVSDSQGPTLDSTTAKSLEDLEDAKNQERIAHIIHQAIAKITTYNPPQTEGEKEKERVPILGISAN